MLTPLWLVLVEELILSKHNVKNLTVINPNIKFKNSEA